MISVQNHHRSPTNKRPPSKKIYYWAVLSLSPTFPAGKPWVMHLFPHLTNLSMPPPYLLMPDPHNDHPGQNINVISRRFHANATIVLGTRRIWLCYVYRGIKQLPSLVLALTINLATSLLAHARPVHGPPRTEDNNHFISISAHEHAFYNCPNCRRDWDLCWIEIQCPSNMCYPLLAHYSPVHGPTQTELY